MKNQLKRLKDGNQRFVSGTTIHDIDSISSQRISVVKAQEPFAVILGCSDSRVPAELVFDQGLGDLFVIRVAGNVVAPSQIGSVEFAVSMFGSPLVVVLGHSNCGAIEATIDAMKNPDESTSINIQSIVKRIKPAIEPLLLNHTLDQVRTEDAVKANVLKSVAQLTSSSEIIESKVADGQLNVIGACYDLKTGVVDFYD
ncbi:carbonic anhydrase [Marinicella litoralis]|uniref:carbonic anhydrase n=1 Tax=Marinicella litoralis TaxID=644220 RepID=A0A4R6XQX9_9GAMM|nr:carbonic anhydrase [Marinicella litoralis]TDR20640.1 carbonic anhydrase [Marinicella litoralis]